MHRNEDPARPKTNKQIKFFKRQNKEKGWEEAVGVGWPRKTHLVSLCFLVLVWAEGPKGSRDQLDPPLASQEAGHSLKNLQVLVILEAMLLKAMAMQILKLNQLGNHPSSFHTYLLLQEILAQRKSCTATVLAALAASARLPNHLVRLHPWAGGLHIMCWGMENYLPYW